MTMNKLVIIFLLLLSPYSLACNALKEAGLDFKQRLVLRHSFEYGRPYDLSYSLSAIAWKESNAGVWRINLQDPSAGIHMITLTNAIDYANIRDTGFNRNKLAQELVENPNMSAGFAVRNLLFWESVHGSNWRATIQSYNAGYSNSNKGREYAKDIARRVVIIKQCNWE